MKYIKLLQARQTSGLSNNVTTANEKYIKNLTSGGETYTRDYDEIDPLTMSTTKINRTGEAPLEASYRYYPKNAMGNYTFGQVQITPSSGAAPQVETEISPSLGGNIYITLTVEQVGDYEGTIRVPVTSTGYALLNGEWGERTMTQTFEIEYELHCVKKEVGVIYNFAPSTPPSDPVQILVDNALYDYELFEAGETAAPFSYLWGQVAQTCTIVTGSAWETEDVASEIETGTAQGVIFFLSNYSPDSFPGYEVVVLGTGDIPRASTFGTQLATVETRNKPSFIYIGKLTDDDDGSADVNKAVEYAALQAFMGATESERETAYDGQNQMSSSHDVSGAEIFVNRLFSGNSPLFDPQETMLIVPDTTCAQAVVQVLQSKGFNTSNELIETDPERYIYVYCIGNGYFSPDAVSAVQNGGLTGCAYGTPGASVLPMLVDTVYAGDSMNNWMADNGYDQDSNGRYNLFTWDHTFTQYEEV